MKTPRPAPQDEDVDRLLARHYHDTTPEFEARWVALKRELRQSPVRRRPWAFFPSMSWLTLGGLAAALMVLAVVTWRRESPSTITADVPSPALMELFAMNAVLDRATALLDEENREVLLNLPARPPAPM
jgi:hypothetical protein